MIGFIFEGIKRVLLYIVVCYMIGLVLFGVASLVDSVTPIEVRNLH